MPSAITQLRRRSTLLHLPRLRGIKDDGSVITWGDASNGGDSSAVSSQLSSGVAQLFSTGFAFAALKEDGSVITWGPPPTAVTAVPSAASSLRRRSTLLHKRLRGIKTTAPSSPGNSSYGGNSSSVSSRSAPGWCPSRIPSRTIVSCSLALGLDSPPSHHRPSRSPSTPARQPSHPVIQQQPLMKIPCKPTHLHRQHKRFISGDLQPETRQQRRRNNLLHRSTSGEVTSA